MQMEADWWARGIAIGGALVAASSLAWNIIAWRRQGPVIKVRVTCSGRGAEMRLAGRVHNAGRIDARIEEGVFAWYVSAAQSSSLTPRILRCPVPADHLEGLSLPVPLAAQAGAEFTVNDLNGIDPGQYAVLHEQRQATLYFRTATGKWARGRIKYPRQPGTTLWYPVRPK